MRTTQDRRARRQTPTQDAFTRTELVTLLAALSLLAFVVFPVLANSKPRSQRLTCVSNLREIGQAFASWSSDSENLLPMQVPPGPKDSGQSILFQTVWFNFIVVAGHFRSPGVFVCPSDSAKRPATDFSSDSAGGFLHANYRDNAISYLLGHPFIEGRADILSGDRNLTGGPISASCSYWNQVRSIPRTPPISVGWTSTLHNSSGNVLLSDGRVLQLSNLDLRQRLTEGASESNAEFHYLAPNP